MADDVFDAARKVSQGGASAADKLDRADNPPAKKSPKAAPRSSGVTSDQALRSERKAAKDEGARAFGAPLGTESERQRQAQSTDENQ